MTRKAPRDPVRQPSPSTSPPQRTSRARASHESPARTHPPRRPGAAAQTASQRIDERIRELGGWRAETLTRVRALILAADPGMTEEWKWNHPVWSHDGIVCTGEAYAKVVKLTFARGARVQDPAGLFNASLQGNTRRAIDLREGEPLDARAFQALVRAAVAVARPTTAVAKAGLGKREARSIAARDGRRVVLLSGGNPQIAKADGDAPVQAYIAAMPGWKRDLGKRLDALIERTVPNVRKAVRWNTPFYGIEGQGWFLGFHTFTNYVKVSFFRGTSLRPLPPGASKVEGTRYVDLRERDEFDDARMATWVRQAAALPGWEFGQPS